MSFALVPFSPCAERIDALAAVVDGHIITLSDVRVASALELPPFCETGPSPLDALIVEQLMYNKASRLPLVSIGRAVLSQELSLFKKRFRSEDAYRLFLRNLELKEEELREILRKRILIRRFIEFRFKPFIMVEPIEVDEALRRARAQGKAIELDAWRAKETVRKALTEKKLQEAVEVWIIDLREKAEVEVLLEPEEIAAFLEKGGGP